MTHPRRRPRPTYGRPTRWTATLSAIAVVLTFVIDRPSDAQTQTQTEVGSEVRNGTAKATALVQRVAPGVGQAEIGVSTGTAVTQLTNSLAQATAQAVDLGLLGTALTVETCGTAGPISDADLPQPTSADNRNGDASTVRELVGLPGAPAGVGRMAATAVGEAPEAAADAQVAAVEIAPGFRIGAGSAHTVTRVLPGEGREAVATVDVSLDLGPLLRLSGMRWEARHRSGVESLSEGSFEILDAGSANLPLPTSDLTALEAAINGTLALTGVSIRFPRVERVVEPVDLVRVTPLRIELRDPPLQGAVLGPILDLTREQRGRLFDSLVAAYCPSSTALLVGDIGLSIASGTGVLVIELGGVEATSGDFLAESPFGAPVTPAEERSDTLGVGRPSVGAGGPDTAAPEEHLASSSGSAGPLREVCVSVHPLNRRSCSFGAAGTVGVLGLLATVSVAGADLVQRRRHRDAPHTGPDQAEVEGH
jgi:hypothetical protein